ALPGFHPSQPVPANAAVADDRQRVLMVEPRADAVDLERPGIHFATLVEEHRRRVAGAAGPFLAERRVDEPPLLRNFRIVRLFAVARHRLRSPPAAWRCGAPAG